MNSLLAFAAGAGYALVAVRSAYVLYRAQSRWCKRYRCSIVHCAITGIIWPALMFWTAIAIVLIGSAGIYETPSPGQEREINA